MKPSDFQKTVQCRFESCLKKVVRSVVKDYYKDGTYQFSWQDSQMKRRFVYARTLDDLREKEKRIQKDKCDGIKT